MASNYKIVIKLKDIQISDTAKENIEGKIEIGENIKYFKLPIKEVITFEIDNITPSIMTTFFDSNHSKKPLGVLTIPIPLNINKKEEYELEKDFSLDSSQRTIQGSYFLIIFNRNISRKTSQDNIKPILSSQKSQKSEKITIISKTPEKSIEFSTSKLKKPVQKSNSSKKSTNLKTSPMNTKKRIAKQDNVTLAINKSMVNASQMADSFEKDNKDITECLYLNKLNNTDINIEEITTEAKIINNNKLNSQDLKDIVPSRKELDSYRDTLNLSPQKLKERYQDLEKSIEKSRNKGQRSISPGINNSNGKDLDYSIVKNELWKYSNDQKNQVDYLKLMVFALESKLKISDNIRKENELLKLELKKSEESRNELQQSIRETTQEYKNESFNIQKNFNKMIEDRVKVDEKVKELNKRLDNALQNFENARNMARNMESELKEAKIHLKDFDDIKIQIGSLKNQLQSKESRIIDLNEQFASKLKEIQKVLKEVEQQKDLIFQEKVRINGDLNETRQKLEYEQNRLREKQSELDSLSRKNQILLVNEALLKTTQEEKKNIEEDIKKDRNLIENLSSFIEELKMEVIVKARELDDNEKDFHDKYSLLEQKFQTLDMRNNEQNNTIAILQKNISDGKNTISMLEQLICIKEDVNNQLEFSKDKNEKLVKETQDYKTQITLLTDQIIIQDNKTYDLQNIINHMRDLLNEKEEYVINLKKLILEMREKGGSYVPFRDDPTDKKLADFINSLNDPERVKVMFIREGQGVYQFGTKRVFVKIDQEKIFIRVGGGFISIEDFLQIYTSLELEKMLRNDPVKILTKNIAMNKTIAGRCVNEIEKSKTTQLNPKSLGPLFSKVRSNEKN